MASEPDPKLKVVLIGASGVGKTSLMLRYSMDVFDEQSSPTVGVDLKYKVVKVSGQTLTLWLWDTVGSERFRTATKSYYRGVHGAVLVYDVSRRESFEDLEFWRQELELKAYPPNVVKILVGNKLDKQSERRVTRQEGADYAAKHGMLFVEASARTSENVARCFQELVMKMVQSPNFTHHGTMGAFKLANQKTKNSSWCAC